MIFRIRDELARYGPASRFTTPSLAHARRYCETLTRSHYENFSVASFLLPRPLRPHFHAIYAYCRWADDLADDLGNPEESLVLLEWWRQSLLDVYRGRVTHPVMIALQPTIERFSIPPEPFLKLLDAFVQDQSVRTYATRSELLQYCEGSANPVGRLVLYLCECFTEENAKLSDATCTALQLTNFWQDVARDRKGLGRVYLPEEDLRQFGVTDSDLQEGRFSPGYAAMLRMLVAWTRRLFDEGRPLLDRLPPPIRRNIALFERGGRAILDKIEAVGFDTISHRPTLSKWEKLRLIGSSLISELRAKPSRSSDSGIAASFRWCGTLTRKTAKNFGYSFWALPRPKRRAMDALYAFMRLTDDLGDDSTDTDTKRLALQNWRSQLDETLDGGEAKHPALPALRATIERYSIPRGCLYDVIAGVESDLNPVNFRTYDELLPYCRKVASAVGIACIHIWGFRSTPESLHAADEAGIALQLTNILRDLKEDAGCGRIYLPEEVWRPRGLPPERWSEGGEIYCEMIRCEAERIRGHYQHAERLLRDLSTEGRAVFGAMMRIYRELLEKIAADPLTAFHQRAKLSTGRKLRILLTSFVGRSGSTAIFPTQSLD